MLKIIFPKNKNAPRSKRAAQLHQCRPCSIHNLTAKGHVQSLRSGLCEAGRSRGGGSRELSPDVKDLDEVAEGGLACLLIDSATCAGDEVEAPPQEASVGRIVPGVGGLEVNGAAAAELGLVDTDLGVGAAGGGDGCTSRKVV